MIDLEEINDILAGNTPLEPNSQHEHMINVFYEIGWIHNNVVVLPTKCEPTHYMLGGLHEGEDGPLTLAECLDEEIFSLVNQLITSLNPSVTSNSAQLVNLQTEVEKRLRFDIVEPLTAVQKTHVLSALSLTSASADISALQTTVGSLQYATPAQGALADTAVQPPLLNSELTDRDNDIFSLETDVGALETLAQTFLVQAEILTLIDARIDNLVGAAPDALDTLVEIAASIQTNQADLATILTAQANRIRFDQAQTLTPAQKQTVLSTLGIETHGVDIGNLDNELMTLDAEVGVIDANQTTIQQDIVALQNSATQTITRPFCKVALIGAVTAPVGVWTRVNYGSNIDWNNGGVSSSGWDSTNFEYVVPRTGYYSFEACVTANLNADHSCNLRIRRDANFLLQQGLEAHASEQLSIHASTIAHCSAGQKLYAEVQHNDPDVSSIGGIFYTGYANIVYLGESTMVVPD